MIRLPLDSVCDVDAFSLPFYDRPVVVLGSDMNGPGRGSMPRTNSVTSLRTAISCGA